MSLSPVEKQKISKRNFVLMIVEGALFWGALAFVEPNTVVSVFINEMTGSMQLAGLAATLRLLSVYIGQFIMGMYIYRILDKGVWLKKFGLWVRLTYWMVLPPLLMGMGGTPVVLIFIFAYALFFFLDGLVGLAWTEISAHTIVSRNRGVMHGMQQFLSALMSLGSATIIKVLLDSSLEPNIRYAFIFGLCAVVFTINGFSLMMLKDIPRDLTVPRRSFSRYIGAFKPLWQGNPLFRRLVYCRLLYSAGTMAAALLVLFGRSTGGMSLQEASSMVYMQVLGQLVGGLMWGGISRKFGNVVVMRGGNLMALLIGGIGVTVYLLANGGSFLIPCAVMIFLSGVQGNAYSGFSNSVIDYMPPEQLSPYIVLNSVVLMPLAVMPYLASFLAEIFSFLPVFALLIVFGVIGMVQTVQLKKILPEISRDELPEG